MICLILANKTYETHTSEIRCVPMSDKHRCPMHVQNVRCVSNNSDKCLNKHFFYFNTSWTLFRHNIHLRYNNELLCILYFFLTLNQTFYNRINKPNDAFPPPPPPLSIGFPYEKVQQDSSSSSITFPFQVTIFLLVATISMLVPKTWPLI